MINVHKLLGAIQIAISIIAAGIAPMAPTISLYLAIAGNALAGSLSFYFGTTQ